MYISLLSFIKILSFNHFTCDNLSNATVSFCLLGLEDIQK
jgi:hypothetical protein